MFSRLFTPDTLDYMIAGYIVVALGIGMYITSLFLRWRKALEDYKLYQNDLEQQ